MLKIVCLPGYWGGREREYKFAAGGSYKAILLYKFKLPVKCFLNDIFASLYTPANIITLIVFVGEKK